MDPRAMTLSRLAALLENGFSILLVELMLGYIVTRLAFLVAASALEGPEPGDDGSLGKLSRDSSWTSGESTVSSFGA